MDLQAQLKVEEAVAAHLLLGLMRRGREGLRVVLVHLAAFLALR
jgi:hypothetical protein